MLNEKKNRNENQKRKTTNEMLRKFCGWLRTMPMAADNKQLFLGKFVQFSLSCISFVQIEFLELTCIPIILILAILDKHSSFITDIDIFLLFSL